VPFVEITPAENTTASTGEGDIGYYPLLQINPLNSSLFWSENESESHLQVRAILGTGQYWVRGNIG